MSLRISWWYRGFLHCRTGLSPSADLRVLLRLPWASHRDCRRYSTQVALPRQQCWHADAWRVAYYSDRPTQWTLRHHHAEHLCTRHLVSSQRPCCTSMLDIDGLLIHRFGTMTMELGDSAKVRCVTSDLSCDLDFKTKVKRKKRSRNGYTAILTRAFAWFTFFSKGFFSGQWNSVAGKIRKESTQEVLAEISGQWSNELYIKRCKVRVTPNVVVKTIC